MARDTVIPTLLTLNAGVAKPAGYTIVPANGVNVPNTCPTRRLIFHVANTSGASANVTFRAGINPPAVEAGQGDLVIAVAAGATQVINIDSGRFYQADGSMNIDFDGGFTGTLIIYERAKNA